MKKTKFIVAFLLVCVLSIGGAVVVFGATYEGSYMTVTLNDDSQVQVPFVDLTKHEYLFVVWNASAKPYYTLFVDPELTAYGSAYGIKCSLYYESQTLPDGNMTAWTVMTNNAPFNFNRAYYTVSSYASTVQLDYDGKVVFRKAEVPVVVAARVLPEKIAGTVKTITVVAVGCLALLIGSIVLLPKLRRFLAV